MYPAPLSDNEFEAPVPSVATDSDYQNLLRLMDSMDAVFRSQVAQISARYVDSNAPNKELLDGIKTPLSYIPELLLTDRPSAPYPKLADNPRYIPGVGLFINEEQCTAINKALSCNLADAAELVKRVQQATKVTVEGVDVTLHPDTWARMKTRIGESNFSEKAVADLIVQLINNFWGR